jgi:hypothetical protein
VAPDDRTFGDVYYWDDSWEELEQLRIEDATLEDFVAALETMRLAKSVPAARRGEDVIAAPRVRRVTMEVTFEK